MATGASTAKRNKVSQIRNLQQKVAFFRWKHNKYQDAVETYFIERNYPMMELCEKNVAAYSKAYRAATNTLNRLECQLAEML